MGGGGAFDCSPDGREVVSTSNRDPQPATSTNSDLWVVPIDGSPGALAALVSTGALGPAPLPAYAVTTALGRHGLTVSRKDDGRVHLGQDSRCSA